MILMLIVLFLIWFTWAVSGLWPDLKMMASRIYLVALPVLAVPMLLIDGTDWQFMPMWFLFSLSWLMALRRIRKVSQGKRLNLKFSIGILASLILAGIALAPPLLFPSVNFLSPQGDHPVGTTIMHWVDENREEPRTEDPQDHRELLVQMWYPAERNGDEKSAAYHPDAEWMISDMSRIMGFPTFLLSEFTEIKVHAWADAALQSGQKKYPVLLFSHGNSGFAQQNTFQAEELASHGYIVVGINHTYNAAGTVFPDGRKIESRASTTWFTQEQEAKLLQEWTADARFVLDQLERMHQGKIGSSFAGRLNLDRIGYFGHSFGGVAAAETMLQDSRIKAGAHLDGYPFGTAGNIGLQQPFMVLESDDLLPLENMEPAKLDAMGLTTGQYDKIFSVKAERHHRVAQNGYYFHINGTMHFDYTDMALWSPLGSVVGLTGKMEPERVHRMVNDLTLAFFNQSLRGIPSDLLEQPEATYFEIIKKK